MSRPRSDFAFVEAREQRMSVEWSLHKGSLNPQVFVSPEASVGTQ
jgi:hypothetical protein